MRWLLSLCLVAFALTGACQSGPPGDAECMDNGDCSYGFACVDFACAAMECLSHSDCPFNTQCVGESSACEPGCDSDTDCAAGTACIEGSCAALGCTDAHLDCAFGEFCDVKTGACTMDEEHPSCAPCDPEDPNACGADGLCAYQEKDGPDYSYCRWYCDPSGQDQCPRGLACSPVQGSDDPNTKVCWTQCSDYDKGGYLE